MRRVRSWIYVFVAVSFIACKDNGSEKQFEISGVITNTTKQKIYLEELPAGTTQGTIVDSSIIGKDGRYSLKTNSKEAQLYSLRLNLGQDEFPLAYLINDVPDMKVDIHINPQNNQFAEKYEITGSPASQEMKDFVFSFENDLQKLYSINHLADSLHKTNASDSIMASLDAEWRSIEAKLKVNSLASIKKANNPALLLFELGYFQEVNRRYGLESLSLEEVNDLLNNAAIKFPDHKRLAEIKKDLNDKLAKAISNQTLETKWVGKQAPDFSLPDANGKEIKLSSYRGKYVLVDFWASWCTPCRQENPNVVSAYNKFRDKNFAILGVSLDNPGEKDKWLKAVKADNLTWTQVSDLKGWESVVVNMYDFGQVGIPYNILLDPEGMVIAERLQGPALEAKLEEVLE